MMRPGLDDDAPPLFLEVVSVQVKPAGRDEYVAGLTVRLKPDNPAHPRSLLLELTDEADLLFYHSLVLGEGDFHMLKSEQHLLVDFQTFPLQLAELLRCCTEAQNTTKGSTLRRIARLECSSSGESLFSIVESNQFRELTHIALRLRQGTDEAVKRHLAGGLRGCRAERAELAERLRASNEALSQARHQADELGTRARVVAEERAHLEKTLEATHQRELAELRQEHARLFADAQRTASEERARVEADLGHRLDEAAARATKAERQAEELEQERQGLVSSGKALQERQESAEAQLQRERQEATELREQHKQLELLRFQHEREIGELKVQLSSLRENLSAREQLVASQAAQGDQAAAQRKSLEEMLAHCRQQNQALEEKFALSVQEIAKGNQIIQSLHTGAKQAKAKLKLKSNALAQQEKAALELSRAEELGKHALEEKERDIARGKEREERLQQDLADLKRKLTEAHEVLRSNQDVIEYLNRQLTERELRAIPPLPKQLEAEPRGAAGSGPLAELLRRAEGAGQVLGGNLGARGGQVGHTFGTGLGSLGLASSSSLGALGVAQWGIAGRGMGGESSLAGSTGSSGVFGARSPLPQEGLAKLGSPGAHAKGGMLSGTSPSTGRDAILQGAVAYRPPVATGELVAAV